MTHGINRHGNSGEIGRIDTVGWQIQQAVVELQFHRDRGGKAWPGTAILSIIRGVLMKRGGTKAAYQLQAAPEASRACYGRRARRSLPLPRPWLSGQ